VKTLGLHWHPVTDNFQFSLCLKDMKQNTKRTVLAVVASIFDPLGLLGPIIVRCKVFLQTLFASAEHQKSLSSLTQEGVTWHTIPPNSPHFGGLWEARIKSMKYHLHRAVGLSTLTFEEFTPMSTDPNDCSVLTPGHFLIGGPLISLPEPDLTPLSINHLSRWQLIQRLSQQVWKRWSSDYLCQLQQRRKWSTSRPNLTKGTSRPNLTKGTLVLIKEDNLHPLVWRKAIVEQVHPGPDGIVRVVTVRTEGGCYKRPIQKLCVLPTDC
jgi:hypothetical protein